MKTLKNTLPQHQDNGKFTITIKKIKSRQHFAPPTVKHKDKSSYNRRKFKTAEDLEME